MRALLRRPLPGRRPQPALPLRRLRGVEGTQHEGDRRRAAEQRLVAAAEPDPVAAQGGDGAALRLHRAAQGLPQQPGELGRGEAAVVRVDRLGVLAMEVWQRRDERTNKN